MTTVSDVNSGEISSPIMEKRAGITICGLLGKSDKCSNIFINNNIVAGAPFAGYVMTG
jgi:hypothetical protein